MNLLEPEKATLVELKKENYDTATFVFRRNKTGRFSFLPGQFNMLGIPGFGEAPLSFSSVSDGAVFSHTVRRVGNVTGRFFRLKKGDRVDLRGPYGTSWPMGKARGKDVVVVAGGIGMAPLRPVVLEMLRRRPEYGKIYLLYGARTPKDILFRKEFSGWKRAGIKLLLTVDEIPGGSRWKGSRGVVTALFDDVELSSGKTVVFTCGPEIMMRFAARGLILRGLSETDIYVSMERRMKCGFGHCGHCQIGAKFVCKDGPVFAYPDIRRFADTLL